jgi:hypothetical protein
MSANSQRKAENMRVLAIATSGNWLTIEKSISNEGPVSDLMKHGERISAFQHHGIHQLIVRK